MYGDLGILSWRAADVAACFRERGVMPLRPEELALTDGDQGLPGTVVNALFSGREMHYTVELESGPVQVYTQASLQREVGSSVSVARLAGEEWIPEWPR